MKISTVSEMRALDSTAIKDFGIKEELLMENAGEALYFILSKEVGIKNKKFVVLCGIGNNGGDGFVIARKIHSSGGTVKVFVLGDKSKYKGAARLNLDIISGLPIEVGKLESVESIKTDIYHCEAIVDAIFGTGLTRDVGGLYRDVIELVNSSSKTVFSADIPSGVHGNTGRVMGTAIRADHTVTFGLPKLGNILFPGYDLCGKLYVTHISFPPSMYETESMRVEINTHLDLPFRSPDSHKGDFGDVLFIAGAVNYFGAPYFAALSFMKAGGGYSRLAAPKSMIPFIANKASEIVFTPQEETVSGTISLKNSGLLLELADKVDMVVLGPGLTLEEETQQLVRQLAREIKKPLLVDGDGITALCGDLQSIKQREAATILTPHMGEMSRLVNMTIAEIGANKVDILQRTAGELGAIIVLKGARTLIGFPDRKVFVNMSGNAGMATAGSGDVLTGTIAAMFGLGLSIENAVRKGVFIHGLSGDLAAQDRGKDGMTAQDIMDYLPMAMKMDRDGLDEGLEAQYEGAQVI